MHILWDTPSKGYERRQKSEIVSQYRLKHASLLTEFKSVNLCQGGLGQVYEKVSIFQKQVLNNCKLYARHHIKNCQDKLVLVVDHAGDNNLGG